MNPDNYGSREACERLADAGIVVETEVFWCTSINRLVRRDEIQIFEGRDDIIPALSMAEVWRMLPEGTAFHKVKNNKHVCWAGASPVLENINPTDTLIYLKIWLVEQEKDKEAL